MNENITILRPLYWVSPLKVVKIDVSAVIDRNMCSSYYGLGKI